MPTKSYWISSSRLPPFPALEENLKVDAVVVGAGNTGVITAYLLKQAGLTVALIERNRCGGVNTGHTSAHLTYVTDLRIRELVDQIGREHAQAVLDAGHAAMLKIEEVIRTEKIACEFEHVPGFLHASLQSEADESEALKEEAQLANELGYPAQYVDRVPLFGRSGVRFPNQARFHPLKYLAGLLKQIPGAGSHVFEHTEAESFNADPMIIKANGKTIQCGFAMIATDVPLQGNAGLLGAALFQSKLAPYTSYVISAKLPPRAMPDALFWDTADPYFFTRMQRRGDQDYVIFGGLDHKTGQQENPNQCFLKLEAMLHKHLPQAQVQHRWSGQVIEAVDGLPFIGETAPRQFVGTGFSGNGLTFGTLAGIMACDAVLGRKNPWSSLFAVDRKPLATLPHYLRENADYPYFMLKDWLRKAEGESLESVGRGEGKILKLDGHKVAVYRDPAGKLTQLSPVCTHLGCVVRWNDAESTWDCPCHGSRFCATGEVLAGPAEKPLEPAKQ